ncbi:hypothetical protein SAMN05421640_1461 [Ekhidna lutea]|uniref:Uncharacterized protein n=2 Tax=Ekhidna lutea TaxID=447679 RepID=A0A239HUR7_EKHLU|nr:hypothetical protein SAMN05421640_1461 [Ekhidna lutea]
MVKNGLSPYTLSSFGYTPLSIIISGYTAKLFEGIIPFEYVMSALGMINYLMLCWLIYSTVKKIHKRNDIATYSLLLFLGVGIVGKISTVILDPKVLLSTLFVSAYYAHLNKRVVLSFFLASCAVWVWQPSIIILLGLILLVLRKVSVINCFYYLAAGTLLASILPITYLLSSGQLQDFIQTAIIDRFVWATEERNFSPFKFLTYPFYQKYVWDLLFFILALTGFLASLLFRFKQYKWKIFSNGYFDELLIITFFFVLLLNLESGNRDLLTFMSFLAIWVSYSFRFLKIHKLNLIKVYVLLILIGFLDFFIPYHNDNHTQLGLVADQIAKTNDIKNGNYLTVGRSSEGLNVIWKTYPYDYRLRLHVVNIGSKYNCNSYDQEIGNSIRFIVLDKSQFQPTKSSCYLVVAEAIQQKPHVTHTYGDILVLDFIAR